VQPGRAAWVQLVRGRVLLGDRELAQGDGAAVQEGASVEISGLDGAEILLFDLR